MDANEYGDVIKTVAAIIGVSEPSDILIRNVITYCKKLNHQKLKQESSSYTEWISTIANLYVDSSTQKPINFDHKQFIVEQDMEKKESNPIINWLGKRMPYIASKALNIYIDSRLRDISSYNEGNTITDFNLVLVPRLTRASLGDGRIQSRVMPSQITYFKIGNFKLPYPANQRSHNTFNEITLTFIALRNNGLLGREDTYHFTFTYTVDSNNTDLVILTPTNEYCRFSPPIRDVDNVSFRLNDPLYPITFSNDRMKPFSINYLSVDGRIDFSSPHNLQTNDVVIIDGLTTLDDAANTTILNQINNKKGISITRIDGDTIALGIDLTNIISPDMNSKPWIIFYSKTFRFALEIGYQDENELYTT